MTGFFHWSGSGLKMFPPGQWDTVSFVVSGPSHVAQPDIGLPRSDDELLLKRAPFLEERDLNGVALDNPHPRVVCGVGRYELGVVQIVDGLPESLEQRLEYELVVDEPLLLFGLAETQDIGLKPVPLHEYAVAGEL